MRRSLSPLNRSVIQITEGDIMATADRVARVTCTHDCPDACAMLVTVRAGRAVDVSPNPAHPVTGRHLCVKVDRYLERVYHPDRLLTSLRRSGPKGSGAFERISWGDALDVIVSRWREIIATDGAAAILPYSYLGSMGTLTAFGTTAIFAEGHFPTPSTAFEFVSDGLARAGLGPMPVYVPPAESPETSPAVAQRYPLRLLTLKRHYSINSSYGALPVLLRAEPEPLLELHVNDAQLRGIGEGQAVRVWNGRGSVTYRAHLTDRLRAETVAAPFGPWMSAGASVKQPHQRSPG
jgi:anaerobic selenocysteine-containing dehydrogenase